MVLTLTGGASGWALTSRARSAVLYRLSGSPRRAGTSQASAVTVARCRGGKAGFAPAAGSVGQPEPVSGPETAPVPHPVLMVADLPAGGHSVERRLGVQQQRQLGPIDLRLGRGMASDQVFTARHLLVTEGRLIRRGRASHHTSP